MHTQSQTTATDRSDTDSIIYKSLLALSWGIYGGIIGTFLFSPLEKEGKKPLKQTHKKSKKRYVTVGKAVCYCRKSGMLLSEKRYVTVGKKIFFGLNTWFERDKKN